MAVHCIVPARMGSSRFPGKPLIKILGKEMIVRTMERARLAHCFDRIVCATDSEEIAEVVSKVGFDYVLTGPAATGSDRVAQAAKVLDLDLVVNLQGDEPLVEPTLLADVAKTLESHPDEWVTVACPLDPGEAKVPSVVKVLVEGDYALDFSRSVAVEDAVRQPDAADQLRSPLPGLFSPKAAQLHRIGDVLGDGQKRQQAEALVDHRGVLAAVAVEVERGGRLPVEQDFTLRGQHQPGHQRQQRAFAGAGFAHQRVELPLFKGAVYAVERVDGLIFVLVTVSNTADLEN